MKHATFCAPSALRVLVSRSSTSMLRLVLPAEFFCNWGRVVGRSMLELPLKKPEPAGALDGLAAGDGKASLIP